MTWFDVVFLMCFVLLVQHLDEKEPETAHDNSLLSGSNSTMDTAESFGPRKEDQ